MRIDPKEPCDVVIQGTLPPTTVLGAVRDLSLTGLSVETEYNIGNVLILGECLGVTLRLAGVEKKLVLRCKIAWREFLGRAVVYGIAFDPKQTSGFKKKQRGIQKFIEERRKPEEGPLHRRRPRLGHFLSFQP